MKAVKINMSDGSASKPIKAVLAGVLVNSICVIISTIILTLLMTVAGNLFDKVADYLMLLPLIAGGYTGAFTAARINKSAGLLLGSLSAAIVMIIMLIIGFSAGIADISYIIILKAVALFLPAAIGGVKGVNKKEKFKV